MFFGLAIVIFGVLSFITCCITCFCNHFKHRNPTCSARYTYEVDANANEEGNNFLKDNVGPFLNESDLAKEKDDVIVIQMTTMDSNTLT